MQLNLRCSDTMLKTLIRSYKKMIRFLYKKSNNEGCHDIVSISFCQKEGQHKIKFTVAGMFFPATLSADEITDNPTLLNEFNYQDQLSILFYSSKSIYKITAIDFMDQGEKMISIQATIGKKSWTKRFTLEEIMQQETIVQKLPEEEKDFIATMITKNNVIPFERKTQTS